MRRTITCLVALSALLLGGCAADQRSNALTETLLAYANAVRWDGFPSAWQFVDPKVREKHPLTSLDQARFQQVRVSDYDDGNGAVPDGKNQVTQVVKISLINRNTQSERSVIDHQTWRYDPVAKRWWLESGLPDITQ
ncbi:hypothetical protein CS053_17020 [Rhodanobacter glycinis]|jgi:hypothetical protein|uniref:Lipoprotein n=1 Tax=Rhodanobacter glycinis TaxID=582702 RepID=A0A5B9E6D6_9GAMM|nr:hypothetical protein [Rhodanobacter glycinis]QEE26011.1 hypothetical protein CS053_17020 [Rhodanobacter glycinis]